MLGMSLKTLNIILMCFDEKNTHLKKKKTRGGTAIAIAKECRKYEKLIWF